MNKSKKERLKEYDAAVDALINWFVSQDIPPADSVPIMVRAIIVAAISHGRNRDLAYIQRGIKIAGDMLHEMAAELTEKSG